MSNITSADRLSLTMILVEEYAFADRLKEYMREFEVNLHVTRSLIASWERGHDEVDSAAVVRPLHHVIPGAIHTLMIAAMKVMRVYPSMKVWIGDAMPVEASKLFHRLYYYMHEVLSETLVSFYGYKEGRAEVNRCLNHFNDCHGQDWQASSFVSPYALSFMQNQYVA